MNSRYLPFFLVLAAIGLVATGCRSVNTPPAVTGVGLYMLNIPLPADAVAAFRLVETTATGEVLSVVSEQNIRNIRRPPIAFSLPYRKSEIRSRAHYAVTCEIRSGERLLFRTAQAFPVLTHGSGKSVEVLLVPPR